MRSFGTQFLTLPTGFTRAAILLVASFVRAPATAQTSTQPHATETTVTVVAPLRYIRPGQKLALRVLDEPDLSSEYTVSPEGSIHLVISGFDATISREWDVSVGGKSEDQAAAAVAASLAMYIRDPQVQLRIVRGSQMMVQVRGAAERTGLVALALDSKLSTLLATCKYIPTADLSHIVILRGSSKLDVPEDGGHSSPTATVAQSQNGAPEPTVNALQKTATPDPVASVQEFRVNFLAYLRGDAEGDPRLADGDVVTIPVRTEKPPASSATARVTGEVGMEATIPIGSGLKLRDAIARAGGFTATADREHVRLVRGADGRISMVDFDRIDSDLSVLNVPLGAGDLVIVTPRDRAQSYSVVGAVLIQRTTNYPAGGHIMLSDALRECGGISSQGDPHHGVIHRGYLVNPAISKDVAFDPERVILHQATDLGLDPGDVVEILTKPKRPNFLQQIAPLLLRFLPL